MKVIGKARFCHLTLMGRQVSRSLGELVVTGVVGVESVTKGSRERQSQVTSSGAYRVSVQTLNDPHQGALGLIF